MGFINQVQSIIDLILKFIISIYFIIFLLLFIFSYHILLFFIRNLKYIKSFKEIDVSKDNKLKDLTEVPLVNIVIPAWKEREIFKGCLLAITKLTYPKLKVIVNAGGEEETIRIAESFKKFEYFNIIYQKEGGGKIKAINDCLSFIIGGVILLIDSDIYLRDEDLFKMLSVIVNKNENVVISMLKPHISQIHKNIVRYLLINRNALFRKFFSQYNQNSISQCTMLRLIVIKTVGKFTEKRLIGDGESIGLDILKKNFKIYQLKSHVQSFNYPDNIKDYISQNIRWIQNSYFNKIKTPKKHFLNFFLLTIVSLYLLIFPFIIFFNLYLFLFGIFLLVNTYLKKIRKILFFKKTSDKKYYGKNGTWFYFTILFYIYIDVLITIYTFFEILFMGDKKFRKRKNIKP